jgi:carbamoyl-phosphate synthase small subunit
MTGYQEVMTDPSYARQIIAFTFPHIGNVGANEEDVEATDAHALGCLVREAVTSPSNFRSQQDFPTWMAGNGPHRHFRRRYQGAYPSHPPRRPPTIAIAHNAKGNFDLDALQQLAAEWPGLEGMDLAKEVSRDQLEAWSGGKWQLGEGLRHGRQRERLGRMWSPSTMAPSVTSSATWSRPALALRYCRPQHRSTR